MWKWWFWFSRCGWRLRVCISNECDAAGPQNTLCGEFLSQKLPNLADRWNYLETLKYSFPSAVWITTDCGKFLKRWEYQTTWPASWKICMQVKKQQLELDIEQQTGSKSGKKYIKAVYCHSAYLTYMQSTSCEMLGWMKHKLDSRFLGEISITSDMQMTSPLWQKVKKN